MPGYDAKRFHPPAPVALVSVYSPKTGQTIGHVPMLLDTGADVTLLPREQLSGILSAELSQQEYELEAFDGSRSHAPVARLEMHFLGKSFRGQFLVVEGSVGILGRNILNSLSLLFDGPSLNCKENK